MLSAHCDRKEICEIHEMTSRANRFCGQFVTDLVHGMKMVHGVHNGQKSFVPEAQITSISEMIEELVMLLTSGCLLSESVSLEREIHHSVPEYVQIDACVGRMLMNFLINAGRHTTQGTIAVDVRVVVDSRDDSPQLQIKVTDSGTGVKEEQRPQLFKAFESDSGSVGLGIFMVKEQSDVLGGCCGFEENPTGGSIFFFSVPFSAASGPRETQQKCAVPTPRTAPLSHAIALASSACVQQLACSEQMSAAQHASGTGLSILLIDDALSLLKMCSLEMKSHGYDVVIAQGPGVGLAMMKEQSYSLVLCDLNMPHQDGCMVTRELRRWEAEMGRVAQPIYALTGLINDEIHLQCVDAGMGGALEKPLNMTLFNDLISMLYVESPSKLKKA